MSKLVVVILLLLLGCTQTRQHYPSYPEVISPLASEPTLRELRAKLRPPSYNCADKLSTYVGKDTEVLEEINPKLQARIDNILYGLHPIAKKILVRTDGVWFARKLNGVAGAYLTCNVNSGYGGHIVLDLESFPLDCPIRDSDVPKLYWSRTGYYGSCGRSRTPTDHALRYILLHELGHALSLYTGEFRLLNDGIVLAEGQNPFTSLSWKLVTIGKPMLVPQHMDLAQWSSLLYAANVSTPKFFQLQDPVIREMYKCAATYNLPMAGFVSPLAAKYPTEDYAEMFAHTILSDEGKIQPQDMLNGPPGCVQSIRISPYFSDGVRLKRLYMESQLGLLPR